MLARLSLALLAISQAVAAQKALITFQAARNEKLAVYFSALDFFSSE